MDGVSIFLAVFACTPDALYCDDLSNARNYVEMDDCHEARDAMLGNSGSESRPMLFARCRYVLQDNGQNFRIFDSCCGPLKDELVGRPR